MKVIFFLFLYCSAVWAMPIEWISAVNIQGPEGETEMIMKGPGGSLREAFYIDWPSDVYDQLIRHCVYFKIPDVNQPGELKVMETTTEKKCHLSDRIIYNVENLWSLSWRLDKERRQLIVTSWPEKGRPRIEKIHLLNYRVTKDLERFSNSQSEGYIPGITFYAPVTPDSNEPKISSRRLDVAEKSRPCGKEFSCNDCRIGWYEVPDNTPSIGPSFCGTIDCGLKNGPACRRGYFWKKSSPPFDCRRDSSFAYCGPGLKVECVGQLAYCR